MNKEIERKFLLDKNIKIEVNDNFKQEITQYYLAFEPEIRLRKIHYPATHKTVYKITKKKGKGIAREETEFNISKEMYLKLKELSEGKIKKDRYFIMDNDLVIAIDIYYNIDLIVTEVEFDNIEDAEIFKPLDWFGEEITYNEKYKNKNLARYGLNTNLK